MFLHLVKLCCQCESVCVCLNVRKPTMFELNVESVGVGILVLQHVVRGMGYR